MSNALSSSKLASSKLASLNPAKITGYSPFKTLMVREFWEHKRAIFLTPLLITGFLIVTSLIGLAFTDLNLGNVKMTAEHMSEIPDGAINVVLFASTLLIWLGVSLAMLFTALGTLYDERKDGSILFWKSMPISDTQTILSKVLTVLFLIPLMAIPFAWIIQVFYLTIMSFLAASTDINIWQSIWAPADFIGVTLFFIAFILTNALWIAPIFAWFMLVSVTAKRAPFLTAIIIPAITIGAEALLFRSNHLANWVGMRMAHGEDGKGEIAQVFEAMDQDKAFDLYALTQSLFSSTLTTQCATGLVIAGAMTYATIQLRKRSSI